MKFSEISICYHPTTIVLVDDDKIFLNQLNQRLMANAKLPVLSYSDPQAVLRFLTKEYQPSPFICRCLQSSAEDSPLDKLVMNFNIRSIYQEIYNSHRFAEITVLVTDYAMPTLNGLALCQQLRSLPIKTLMLTGEADKDLAIQAFNEGSIDKFIMKNNPDLSQVVTEHVQELQHSYLLKLSEFFYNNVIDTAKSTIQCLTNPLFIQLFNEVCEKNHIVEYYLTDEQGSFLLLDAKGKPSWLAVKSAEEMDGLYQFSELGDAPASVLNALKTRKGLVYLQTDADLKAPPTDWERYLHPALPLGDKGEYYYAYINTPNAYDIQMDNIVSYAQYLKML